MTVFTVTPRVARTLRVAVAVIGVYCLIGTVYQGPDQAELTLSVVGDGAVDLSAVHHRLGRNSGEVNETELFERALEGDEEALAAVGFVEQVAGKPDTSTQVVDKEKLLAAMKKEGYPICNGSDDSMVSRLKNELMAQCLSASDSGRLFNHDCGDSSNVYFCIDPDTISLRTADYQCIAKADPRNVMQWGYLKLNACNKTTGPQGFYRFGGYDGHRIINSLNHFCVDVVHQHVDGELIAYDCKDEEGYKPENQGWYFD